MRLRASEFLRRVQAGETFEVTDRGRPIALLSPLPNASPLELLRAAGDVDEATRATSDLPEPMALEPGQASASAVLERLRADER